MRKLTVQLLRHTERRQLEAYLRLYKRSFNPDERVSPRVLRRVIIPSPARVNPVHLFAAYQGNRLVGGACTLVLPAFSVVFGSYIFVDPALRGQGLGIQILRQVLRQERRGPQGWNWRLYGEVTAASGDPWHAALAQAGFRFFPAMWPLVSYHDPAKVVAGKPCFVDVHSCVVLWSGFDASPLAAAPEGLRTFGRIVRRSGYRIGPSDHRAIGPLGDLAIGDLRLVISNCPLRFEICNLTFAIEYLGLRTSDFGLCFLSLATFPRITA
jgi:GNAT superfamily N-acetyltransferase